MKINNKDLDTVNLTRGETIITMGDVFTVRRRVIEEDEDGRTVMIIILQDAESYSRDQKRVEKINLMEDKIQGIDESAITEEFKRMRNKDGPKGYVDPPSDFSG